MPHPPFQNGFDFHPRNIIQRDGHEAYCPIGFPNGCSHSHLHVPYHYIRIGFRSDREKNRQIQIYPDIEQFSN